MFVFHMVFVILTASTADMGMRLPLYRAKFTRPERPTNGTGDDGGYVAWVSTRELVPDTHMLYIAWVALVFSALSAVFHLLNAQVWRTWYLDGIAEARCPSRWIEYALSAPLQGVAIAYLTGTTCTDSVVAVFGLISTTMFFGYLCETSARPASSLTWTKDAWERLTPHFLGYVPFLIAIAMIWQVFSRASQFSVTVNDVTFAMPDFVYYIVISQLVLFSSFTLVQVVVTLRPPKDYVYGEVAYMVLSLVAKGVLSALLLSNVIALQFFGGGIQ